MDFDLYELELSEGFQKQRVRAAVIAAFLSVLTHMFLLFVVSKLSLYSIFIRQPIQQEPKWKPFEVAAVQPAKPAEPKEVDTAGPAGPKPMVDFAREMRLFKREPDAAVIQPPSITEGTLGSVIPNVAPASELPKRIPYEPRQEILQVEDRLVSDEIKTLERRRIPRIDRVGHAPDEVLPADWKDAVSKPISTTLPGGDITQSDIDRRVIGGTYGSGGSGASVARSEPVTEPAPALFSETPGQVSKLRHVEDLLTASISVYNPLLEPRTGYFRIEIRRKGPEVLPVIPKDVILLQDCSNSMAEQRLHFCRDGLLRCLAELSPEDRFNVILFRETPIKGFEGWAKCTPENIASAREVIKGMQPGGNTDIFASIRDVLNMERAPGRPVIALLVSDGLSTVGMTKSTDIIGQFSKLNDGRLSVFTMATVQNADTYLLDLLSYCNRGDSFSVTSGRWDIPQAAEGLLRSVNRPVMSDLRFRFASAGCEAYPVLTPNLYLDRPLVLFGRYPREDRRITLQAVGKAKDVDCDMVFDLDVRKDAATGSDQIRTDWARQRIFHLMGQYARNPNPQTLQEIRETAKVYRVPVPHAGDL